MQARRHTLREIRSTLAQAGEKELEKLIRSPDGRAAIFPIPTKKRSDSRPAKKNRLWRHFELADGAHAMIAEDVLTHIRPSSVRALGENLIANILSCRT